MKSFLLVKTKPGMEKEIIGRFKEFPEVREIHLITGKFDLLVALESAETELDPRQKVADLVVEKVRKAGGIIDTRTILPIESRSQPGKDATRPTSKAFVFIKSEPGREKDLINSLLSISEILGVHLLFGKSDLLCEIETPKSFVNPLPQHIADLVETRIAKLKGVYDTDTYVPLESIIL